MIVFVDRALGRKIIPDALRAIGVQVEVHDAHFPQETRDDEWLPWVGQRGWIVLTKDNKMRGRATEKDALIAYEVGCFAIKQGSISGPRMAALLVDAWPHIEAIVASEQRPFLYRVWGDGSVHVVDPSASTHWLFAWLMK